MKNISEIEAYEEKYPHKLYVNYWVDSFDYCDYGFLVNDEKSYHEKEDVIYVRGDLVRPWHKYSKEKPTNNGSYLCTIIDWKNKKRHVEYLTYNTENDDWLDLNGDIKYCVVAWQELPYPYDR